MPWFFDYQKVGKLTKLFVEAYENRKFYTSITVEPCLRASPDREIWICFTGFLQLTISLNHAWGVHNILPKKGKVYLVNGPLSIAGFTPQESIESMERLGRVVGDIIDQNPGYAINVFSISAGTYPGFYFANKYAANRLVAIAPGPRMGQGIYTSILSQELKRRCQEAGFATWQDYDRVIAPYNQENNVANLPDGRGLLIFGSRLDRVIRNYGTRELVSIVRKSGRTPTFRNYWLFDHTSLGAWLGGVNKLGFDPYGLNTSASPCGGPDARSAASAGEGGSLSSVG